MKNVLCHVEIFEIEMQGKKLRVATLSWIRDCAV